MARFAFFLKTVFWGQEGPTNRAKAGLGFLTLLQAPLLCWDIAWIFGTFGFAFCIAGNEPRALGMQNKYSTTNPHYPVCSKGAGEARKSLSKEYQANVWRAYKSLGIPKYQTWFYSSS